MPSAQPAPPPPAAMPPSMSPQPAASPIAQSAPTVPPAPSVPAPAGQGVAAPMQPPAAQASAVPVQQSAAQQPAEQQAPPAAEAASPPAPAPSAAAQAAAASQLVSPQPVTPQPAAQQAAAAPVAAQAAQLVAPQSAPAAAPSMQSPAAAVTPALPPSGASAALAAADKPAEAPAPHAPMAPRNIAPGAIGVELGRDGANLKVSFPFKTAVPLAVFHRADMLWVVFDSKTDMDLSALDNEPTRTIRGYTFTHTDDADIVRLKLDRPHLSSVSADGAVWTLEIGDSVLEPPHALEVTRNIIVPNRSSASIGFDEPQHLHRLTDPEVGDKLLVVTGFAPERGFINTQEFIEFRALASTQGVVIEPLADDLDRQSRRRQGRDRTSGRSDLVAGAADLAARPQCAAVDVRFADLGLRPRRVLYRSAGKSDQCRCSGAGKQAHDAAARSGALLSRPRHVSGSQGRARRRADRRQAGVGERFGHRAARYRRSHDGSARRRAARICPIPPSATSTTRRCGGRWLLRSRASGRGRARVSRAWKRRSRRCRSNCSASR